MGFDFDEFIVYGEVGKVGVVIDLIDDMWLFFDGILFGEVLMFMIINVFGLVLLLFY